MSCCETSKIDVHRFKRHVESKFAFALGADGAVYCLCNMMPDVVRTGIKRLTGEALRRASRSETPCMRVSVRTGQLAARLSTRTALLPKGWPARRPGALSEEVRCL